MKLISIFFQLIIQAVAFIFSWKILEPTAEMMQKSGLGKLVSLFTMAPLFIVAIIIVAGITLSLVIAAIINIKRYWWLLLIETAAIIGQAYIIKIVLTAFTA